MGEKSPDRLYILKVQLTELIDGANTYEKKREIHCGAGGGDSRLLKQLEEEVDIKCTGRSGLEKLQGILNLRCLLTAEGRTFSSS